MCVPQAGGTGVYSEGIALPAFFIMLLLIALNRANPKLGQVGEAGQQAVDAPLPGCLEAILTSNILAKAKKNKFVAIKSELLSADPSKLFGAVKPNLKRAFEAACKKREKMPAVALFMKFMMSRPTLVADLKERGVIVAKNVKSKPKVTGGAAADLELALSALDVESAFTLCQSGEHGDAANDSIEFDEFVLALGMCGASKYSAVEGMGLQQKCDAIVAEYLGLANIEEVVAMAAPKVERFDPSTAADAPPAFTACWGSMNLESVVGFPTWEAPVFGLLAASYAELAPLFAKYCGDTPNMQQAELVALVMDLGLATAAYPITKIVALFEQVNRESGLGDADLEMHEFLTFLVHLAFSRDGPDPASLEALLGSLKAPPPVAEEPAEALEGEDE